MSPLSFLPHRMSWVTAGKDVPGSPCSPALTPAPRSCFEPSVSQGSSARAGPLCRASTLLRPLSSHPGDVCRARVSVSTVTARGPANRERGGRGHLVQATSVLGSGKRERRVGGPWWRVGTGQDRPLSPGRGRGGLIFLRKSSGCRKSAAIINTSERFNGRTRIGSGFQLHLLIINVTHVSDAPRALTIYHVGLSASGGGRVFTFINCFLTIFLSGAGGERKQRQNRCPRL